MNADIDQILNNMDKAIENCYRPGKPFVDNDERLEHLFDLYEKFTSS
jgi:hypothetical protein